MSDIKLSSNTVKVIFIHISSTDIPEILFKTRFVLSGTIGTVIPRLLNHALIEQI